MNNMLTHDELAASYRPLRDDLINTVNNIVHLARRDPAAAIRRINEIIASQVLVLSSEGDHNVAGWSWPEPIDDVEQPARPHYPLREGQEGQLTATVIGEQLEIRGRQRFRVSSNPSGNIILLVKDSDGQGGYIATFSDTRTVQQDPPIFERHAFRLAETVHTPHQTTTQFQRLAPDYFHDLIVRSALIEELLHAALDIGIVESFSGKAHHYLVTRTRPWQGQGLAKATDDPHLVRRYGEFTATRHALNGLLKKAIDTLAPLLPSAEPQQLKLAHSAIVTLRLYAVSTGRHVINGMLELLGAGATSERHEFDVFWRDFTAHNVAYPPRYPVEFIGRDLIVAA